MGWMSGLMNPFVGRRRNGTHAGRRVLRREGSQRHSWMERLEPRLALANDVAPVLVERINDGLVITYNQSVTADQHVVIDIDNFFAGIGAVTTRVNVYASTNPVTNPPVPPSLIGGAPYLGIDYISVVVPDYDALGVNNNSLTIKGINSNTDRIIVSGSGRTAAGRWSDEEASQLQVGFDIQGIDNLTVTAGGVINVSGAFTNDTEDASIHAIGEIVERETSQLTASIIVGETTPVGGALPQSRLVSNVIQIIGAELDIYSDIEASDAVILRNGENAPADARHDLILPYDITVTGVGGVLELHSTQNIVQLQGSTLIASKLVAVSNSTAAAGGPDDGPWMIDLGSVGNDFNTISIGMTSAPGDDPEDYTAGRVGVRDIDDLTVGDFGILASTGQFRLDVGGALRFDARVEATGLLALSGDSIVSTSNAVMQIGALGVNLRATKEFDDDSTGDIALNAPIVVADPTATDHIVTMIDAAGSLEIVGGLRSPQAGTTSLSGVEGVVISGAVQVGSTLLDKTSGGTTVFGHDLTIVSTNGDVLINDVPGNQAVVKTIEATNIISIDAAANVVVSGSVFSGTLYGDPAALAASEALPSIVMTAGEAVTITATGVLQTSAYQNDADTHPNPLVGRIAVIGTTQFTHSGAIIADGALSIDVVGDVELIGSTQARESITASTKAGSIDVQGGVLTTGFDYGTTPPAPLAALRTPNIRLLAPNGAINTSNLGTLSAGTMTTGATDTYGQVELVAQQDIIIAAAVDTDGGFSATSKIGAFELDALLRTGNGQAAVISAANGILTQGDAGAPAQEFAQIITASLDVTNTSFGDILLTAANNQIDSVTGRNLSSSGVIAISNSSLLTVNQLRGGDDVTVTVVQGMKLLGAINSKAGDVKVTTVNGDLDFSDPAAVISSENGGVTLASFNGAIINPPVLHVTGDVSLRSYAPLALANELTSDAGDISLTSTNGGLTLDGNISAFDRVTLSAARGILQTSGILQATELDVRNTSALPVVLGSEENNIERFAATSVGAVTYSDADGFETGLTRGGVFGDQTVAVSTNGALSLQSGLSSAGALRIVGGLRHARNQLFLSSGTESTPGAVEFVVTNKVSNTSTFSGSLANMITYANENQARFSGAVVPQEIVFDADGYEIETITVERTLPVISQPVTVNGSRTEATVAVERVGIRSNGASSGPVNGLVFGAGSAGSEVTTLSFTNFTRGAGIQLLSSDTTIVDSFFGVDRLGTTISKNRYGVDLFGTAATGNTIGGPALEIGLPDTLLANVFRGNEVGVIARSRASGNEIVGNFIGTNAVGATASGNGVGVQLDAATATLISGNVIANNRDGILLNSTRATAAAPNVITSNDISRNGSGTSTGAGIRLTQATFATIGGLDAGNRVVRNRVGVIVENGSSNNTVAANYVGTNEFGDSVDEFGVSLGNTAGGILVVASIRNTIGGLTADEGNVVANNTGVGITVRNSVARSLATGNVVQANVVSDNTTHGILVDGGSFQTIGGIGDAGNIVHSNKQDGIRLQSFGAGVSATHSSSNVLRGNLVGTDTVDGSIDLGNGRDGIAIVGGSANRVEQGNVSRHNVRNGVYLEASSANMIGSNAAGEGNVIGENGANGIVITSGASKAAIVNNVVSGNEIFANGTSGTTTTGAGVLVQGAQILNTVIGTQIVRGRQVGFGNDISASAGYGVSVIAGATNVQVQGNSIYENGLGSIHRANGANRDINAPTITSAEIRYAVGTAPQVVVTGTMRGTVGQTFAIDFYATPGYIGAPEMRTHVGRVTVTITNVAGTTFSATLAVQSAETGDLIAATATTMTSPSTASPGSPFIATPIGSTSMLSQAVELTLPTRVTSSSPANRTRRV